MSVCSIFWVHAQERSKEQHGKLRKRRASFRQVALAVGSFFLKRAKKTVQNQANILWKKHTRKRTFLHSSFISLPARLKRGLLDLSEADRLQAAMPLCFFILLFIKCSQGIDF